MYVHIHDFMMYMFIFQNQPSQLIFYQRVDQSGPKFSDYHLTETDTPEDLKVPSNHILVYIPGSDQINWQSKILCSVSSSVFLHCMNHDLSMIHLYLHKNVHKKV